MSKSENQQRSEADGLQIPGLVQSQEEVEQVSFLANPVTPPPASLSGEQNGIYHPTNVSQTLHPPSPLGIANTPLPRMDSVDGSYNLADLDTTRHPTSQTAMGYTPLPPTEANALAGMGKSTLTLQPVEQTGELTQSNPGTTRTLSLHSQVGNPASLPGTTASRSPMVIRKSYAQKDRLVRPPQGRRHVISIAALSLLVIITCGTLLMVSPLGRDARATLSGQPGGGSSMIQSTQSSMNLVVQATATAVVHQQNDGFVPASNSSGAILTGSPEVWPFGVCTYWANLRYHELTGHWVTWLGNAYQWVDGARLAGWNVSTSPHVPSIIVLMPGVQGASGYGHVAVVESASGNTVHTSNMNWYANGGRYGQESYYDFTTGPGIYFIWY